MRNRDARCWNPVAAELVKSSLSESAKRLRNNFKTCTPEICIAVIQILSSFHFISSSCGFNNTFYSRIRTVKCENLNCENKYGCTIDQELTDAAPYAPADASFSLTRWQHFVPWNDVIVSILKVWCQIENPTSLIDAYLVHAKNILAKFHPGPIWNDGGLGFLKTVAPTRRTTRTRPVVIWDHMRSVPDPKISVKWFGLLRYTSVGTGKRTDLLNIEWHCWHWCRVVVCSLVWRRRLVWTCLLANCSRPMASKRSRFEFYFRQTCHFWKIVSRLYVLGFFIQEAQLLLW